MCSSVTSVTRDVSRNTADGTHLHIVQLFLDEKNYLEVNLHGATVIFFKDILHMNIVLRCFNSVCLTFTR